MNKKTKLSLMYNTFNIINIFKILTSVAINFILLNIIINAKKTLEKAN